jgi:regulator of PEP synthase PpsR (kinase-PPPase family)
LFFQEYILGTLNKVVWEMNHFNRLVSEQMVTMEKLLYLQAELERCQQIETELLGLKNETDLEIIQADIQQMRKELKEIQSTFEKQTEEVINSYRDMNLTPSI